MEVEIPAVVPNFRLRQYQSTTAVYPNIESESYVGKRSRKKRFITDLISLGIQGFTAFNYWMRDWPSIRQESSKCKER